MRKGARGQSPLSNRNPALHLLVNLQRYEKAVRGYGRSKFSNPVAVVRIKKDASLIIASAARASVEFCLNRPGPVNTSDAGSV